MYTKEKEKLFNENKALMEFLYKNGVPRSEFRTCMKKGTYCAVINPARYQRISLGLLETLNKHLVGLRDNLKPPVFTKKAISDTSALAYTIVSAYTELKNLGWSEKHIDKEFGLSKQHLFRDTNGVPTETVSGDMVKYLIFYTNGASGVSLKALEIIAKNARETLHNARKDHESTMIPHNEHKRVIDDLKAKIRSDWVIIGLLALMILLVGYICITFF